MKAAQSAFAVPVLTVATSPADGVNVAAMTRHHGQHKRPLFPLSRLTLAAARETQ